MTIWYAYHNPYTGNKQLYELKISKVYPDMIFASEDRGCTHMIGVEDEENIYVNHNVAKAFFKQMEGVTDGNNNDVS